MFEAASTAAIGLTAVAVVALTGPGFAQDRPLPSGQTEFQPGDVVFEPAVTDLVASEATEISLPQAEAPAAPDEAIAANQPRGANLREMVASIEHQEPEDAELRCLAAGVFYESKGEPLEGQLAVANVIVNRASSGRFASSMCGVLTQRGQFSFVRGGVVPTPPAGNQWRTAVAVARIARDDHWADPVPGAMYFHAARVSPGWNRPRVARLGNHVFYR